MNKPYYGGVLEKNRWCTFDGCGEKGLWRRGGKVNKRLCLKHYFDLVPDALQDTFKRKLRENGFTKKCIVCGWDKYKCDIHRIIPKGEGGRYEKGNVISLCPNCHRLLTHNKLVIGQEVLINLKKNLSFIMIMEKL